VVSNEDIPALTVAHIVSSFEGAVVIGLLATAQFAFWVTLGYLLLLGLGQDVLACRGSD
jgi:hypothetical protein